ncbi:DNA-directed RNA polymerase subunit alpha [Candidatus Saccharibacteria bacterium]|nr:DNA-directed RNA polymerase subunit alpha [Candidatus Saccharibacteria bacterium]
METNDITIKKEKVSGESGRFIIEPLPSGFGVTLGTALRRVLLSSLPGGAITEIKIQGVSHPFTTIKGVKEDVVELMLNLKRVRFKVTADGPFEGTIEVGGGKRGTKDVKARDIKISSEAAVANPNLKVATLTDSKAKLSVSLVVERGVGYRPAEERESGKVGVIPMDSIFTPVVNVSFSVEATRVGRRTDLDRLILDVTTDATTDPTEAVEAAAGILRDYFGKISGMKVEGRRVKKEEKPKGELSPVEEVDEEVRKTPVSELGLSPRTLNTLEGASVKTVGGLIQKTEEDLLDIKGFGETALSEVKKALKKLSASLKE